MNKNINNKRYNKLLNYRNNYYAGGGDIYQWGTQNPYEWPNNVMRDFSPNIPTTSLNTPLNVPKADIGDFLNNYTTTFGNAKIDNTPGVLSQDVLPSSQPKETSFDKFINSDITKAVAPAVGGIVGGVLSGGMSSGVGNAMSSLGNLAYNIPGPWGTIAGTGLKVAGGLTNAAFGSKLNQENINKVQGDIDRLNNFQSNANNFDTLANTWGSIALGNTSFSNSYVGKDGLFSNKAKNKARELRKQLTMANNFVENSLQNNADTLTQNTMNNLESNYYATGGPISSSILNGWKEGIGSLLEAPYNISKAAYDYLTKGNVNADYVGSFNGGKFNGAGTSGTFDTVNNKIPKNFNEAFDQAVANKQKEFIFRGLKYNTKKEKNPVREINNRYVGTGRKNKKTNLQTYQHEIGPVRAGVLDAIPFACGGFLKHYAFGGDLNTNGTEFSTGLTYINEGNTHESNPYGGVPIGVDAEGKPNLVEEGEVVYNDYVFSNRIVVPKAIRAKYKLRDSKDLTFADAAKQLSKNITERPNDPISKDTLKENMLGLAQAQEGLRAEEQQGNKFAKGGFTYTPYNWVPGYNGGWYDNNGKYTQSYIDKVNNMSIKDINNAFNEQYKFYTNNDNKNTDRWKAIDAFYTANPQYKTDNTQLTDEALPTIRALATDGHPGFMHQFFADAKTNNTINRANRYFLKGVDAKGNPTVTPMSVAPWEGLNDKGQTFSEVYPTYNFVGKQERPIDKGTIYTDYYYNENTPNSKTNKTSRNPYLGWANELLRYAPAIGLGLASISDTLGLTNRPDYSDIGTIEASAKRGNYLPVDWNPIGNYVKPTIFDRDYYTNNLNAQAGATRRAIINQGGNSGRTIAGLLAADYNTQDKLGELFRKQLELNTDQRFKSAEFGRGTDQANATGELQADSANQQAYSNARDFNLRSNLAVAEMRQKERLAAEQGRSANLSSLFQTLGDIGYENKAMNMIRRLAETGTFGVLSDPMLQNVATKKAYNQYQKNKNLTRRA